MGGGVATRAGRGALLLAVTGTLWLLLPRGFPMRAMGGLLWLPLIFPLRTSIAPDTFQADVIDGPGYGHPDPHG